MNEFNDNIEKNRDSGQETPRKPRRRSDDGTVERRVERRRTEGRDGERRRTEGKDGERRSSSRGEAPRHRHYSRHRRAMQSRAGLLSPFPCAFPRPMV